MRALLVVLLLVLAPGVAEAQKKQPEPAAPAPSTIEGFWAAAEQYLTGEADPFEGERDYFGFRFLPDYRGDFCAFLRAIDASTGTPWLDAVAGSHRIRRLITALGTACITGGLILDGSSLNGCDKPAATFVEPWVLAQAAAAGVSRFEFACIGGVIRFAALADPIVSIAVIDAELTGLSITGTELTGNLRVINSRASYINLQQSRIGGALALEIVTVTGETQLLQNTIGGELRIDTGTFVDEFSLFGTAAGILRVTNSLIGGTAYFDTFSAAAVAFRDTGADAIRAYYLDAPVVEFTGLTARDVTLIGSTIETALLVTDSPIETLTVTGGTLGAVAVVAGPCPDRDTCPQWIDRLDLSGSRIAGAVELQGTWRAVDLFSAEIEGGLRFYPAGGTWFRDSAAIDLTNAMVERLEADETSFIGDGGGPGVSFNLAGAKIAAIGPTSAEFQASGVLNLDSDRLTALFVPADHYDSEAYERLSNALRDAGLAARQREVMIAKNWAYADTLTNPLHRGLYYAAGWTNGFGYDNPRAILIFALLVIAGATLHFLNGNTLWGRVWLGRLGGRRRIARAWRKFSYLIADPRREAALAGARRRKSYRGGGGALLYSLWYSLDRSLPPLVLDARFGSPTAPTSMKLVHWFYLQRTVCFAITLFIVAGAFNLFQ